MQKWNKHNWEWKDIDQLGPGEAAKRHSLIDAYYRKWAHKFDKKGEIIGFIPAPSGFDFFFNYNIHK
jgi:hypothetical protein